MYVAMLNHFVLSFKLFLSPAGFAITEDSDPFRFLLSSNVPRDSVPPGLFGCINAESLQPPTTIVSMEQVLIGVCASA